ncbi:MAG: hypothetical protein QM784_12950 [Polyangiaceae bacterium]
MERHAIRPSLRNVNILVVIGATFACTYDYDRFHDADGGTTSRPEGGTTSNDSTNLGGTTALSTAFASGGQNEVQSGATTSASGGTTDRVDATTSTTTGGSTANTSSTSTDSCTGGTQCSGACVDSRT